MWPQHVRQRIHDTYAYFGGSVMITAASAAAVFRSPTLMNLFARTGWVSMIATIALMMGSGMVAQSIPYQEGLGGKQLAWATHCAIMVNLGFAFWTDLPPASPTIHIHLLILHSAHSLGCCFGSDFICWGTNHCPCRNVSESCQQISSKQTIIRNAFEQLQLHGWRYRWLINRCGLRTEWQIPVYGRTIGYWIRCGVCIVDWINVFTANNGIGSWSIFDEPVRWLTVVQRFLIVWHSAHCTQSRNTPAVCRTKIRSSQLVSDPAKHFPLTVI